jgi:hypothetical protein
VNLWFTIVYCIYGDFRHMHSYKMFVMVSSIVWVSGGGGGWFIMYEVVTKGRTVKDSKSKKKLGNDTVTAVKNVVCNCSS